MGGRGEGGKDQRSRSKAVTPGRGGQSASAKRTGNEALVGDACVASPDFLEHAEGAQGDIGRRVSLATVSAGDNGETCGSAASNLAERCLQLPTDAKPMMTDHSQATAPAEADKFTGATELCEWVDSPGMLGEADKAEESGADGAQSPDVKKMAAELQALRQQLEEEREEAKAARALLRRETAMRERLESLCRELQHQKLGALEDCKRIAGEEWRKRKELSDKFQTTIEGVQQTLTQQKEEQLLQQAENAALKERTNTLLQQYDIREQHFARQLETKSLEHQVASLKLQQQEELAKHEGEQARMYQEQVEQMRRSEAESRTQIAGYAQQYEQFQETLTKSSDVFRSFKKETEKLSKSVKRLESENAALRGKSEKAEMALLTNLEERRRDQKLMEILLAQKQRLEGLCRSLQAERKAAAAASATAAPTESDAAPCSVKADSAQSPPDPPKPLLLPASDTCPPETPAPAVISAE
eukprot:TRINITY_DN8535_c0_g1_i1.p1 TRINITY_DN8535_c0_g1~~TRINITY_DN8535_c0_g1_i1.p1  ORF type:complete len:472 (-),score=137.79 TRINITY_DN8535_c0_g1_i1:455-1870(-)